jgi:Glycosyl hydrolase family 99
MRRRLARLAVAAALVALPLVTQLAPTASASPNSAEAVPLFAFYYIWFDPGSWTRAKIDYPELGRYTSDDPRIMRQHIDWAKSAGIDAFIVSWKDTPTNDRRLRLLMSVAKQANFKLAMIYQGLDFNRKPLPASRVAADFVTFRNQFANDPVFVRMGDKPLTIWSGTWAFSHNEVAAVTGPVRSSLLVLNTEKSVAGYQRIADVTDGDAYYWSSVNPATNSGYGAKLVDMGRAIHANHQYWIAPFAPGFDARAVGGTSTVARRDGDTLRTEYATAVQSSPDALGLISWNEFSENTYVEPSVTYGTRYLDALRAIRDTPIPVPTSATDSSQSPLTATGTRARSSATGWAVGLVAGFPVVLLVGVGLLGVVRRHRGHPRRRGAHPPAETG